MLAWEASGTTDRYTLRREDGLLYLTLIADARLEVAEMKELIRQVAALDPGGHCPLLLECPDRVMVSQEARALACRACRPGHAVAMLTDELECRMHGEIFKRLQRPAFPFRVFGWREEALVWLRKCAQRSIFEHWGTVDKDGDISAI